MSTPSFDPPHRSRCLAFNIPVFLSLTSGLKLVSNLRMTPLRPQTPAKTGDGVAPVRHRHSNVRLFPSRAVHGCLLLTEDTQDPLTASSSNQDEVNGTCTNKDASVATPKPQTRPQHPGAVPWAYEFSWKDGVMLFDGQAIRTSRGSAKPSETAMFSEQVSKSVVNSGRNQTISTNSDAHPSASSRLPSSTRLQRELDPVESPQKPAETEKNDGR
jgi:hypothetical protein